MPENKVDRKITRVAKEIIGEGNLMLADRAQYVTRHLIWRAGYTDRSPINFNWLNIARSHLVVFKDFTSIYNYRKCSPFILLPCPTLYL